MMRLNTWWGIHNGNSTTPQRELHNSTTQHICRLMSVFCSQKNGCSCDFEHIRPEKFLKKKDMPHPTILSVNVCWRATKKYSWEGAPLNKCCWIYHLVGGFNPFEKYENISQIGSFPQVGMKINNIWNHHLVIMYVSLCHQQNSPPSKIITGTTPGGFNLDDVQGANQVQEDILLGDFWMV